MFFGGSGGVMPKLYDGWFKKTGQIQKDIVACTKSALKCVCVSVVGSREVFDRNNEIVVHAQPTARSCEHEHAKLASDSAASA